MTEQEKYQHLVQNGWVTENSLWKHNTFKYLPVDLNRAMEIQSQNNIIDKIGKHYKSITNMFGFGYDIRFRKTNLNLNYNNWAKINRPTKNDAEALVRELNNGTKMHEGSMGVCSYRKILILTEGSVKRYFYVPTFNTFCNVALKTIIERDKIGQGYWYDFNAIRPKPPEIPKNKISEIVFSKDRESARLEWVDFDKKLKEYYRQLRLKKLFNKIMKEKNPIDAALFMYERKNELFEGYEIVDAESAY